MYWRGGGPVEFCYLISLTIRDRVAALVSENAVPELYWNSLREAVCARAKAESNTSIDFLQLYVPHVCTTARLPMTEKVI